MNFSMGMMCSSGESRGLSNVIICENGDIDCQVRILAIKDLIVVAPTYIIGFVVVFIFRKPTGY